MTATAMVRDPVAMPRSASPGPRTLSPRQLRLIAGLLVAFTSVTAVVGMLALTSRHSATTVAAVSAEPLMVDAQAIDTSLSDADSTAAGSFLVGRLEPTTLRQRYDQDLAQASAALSVTTQQIGTTSSATDALRTITEALPTYAGIVQSASFNQRQAYYPLAAAYMAEASHLMRMTILPAAQQVYAVEHRSLTGDQGDAVATWLTLIALLLLATDLVLLVLVQRRLSRQFRRTFNVPLIVATGLVAAVAIGLVASVSVQNARVHRAASEGSSTVSLFTQARILALQMRADDELTLLSRDAVSTYQSDYRAAADHLAGLLTDVRTGSAPEVRADAAAGERALRAYANAHDEIRRADDAGDLIGAIELAATGSPTGLPAASNALDQALAAGIATSQRSFATDMDEAADALVPLIVLMVPLLGIACLLILLGLQRRIDEYR